MTKHIIAAVLAVMFGVAIVGAYFYPGSSNTTTTIEQMVAGSPAGTTLNSAKVAEQIITTSTSTIFAFTNTDASDRTITSARIMLKGAISTTTSFTIACATSTSAVQTNGNTNYVLNLVISGATANQFGTTTGAGTFIATSSPGIMGTTTSAVTQNLTNPFARNWAAGTILYCGITTADGTNTFNSGTTGYLAFPYEGQ